MILDINYQTKHSEKTNLPFVLLGTDQLCYSSAFLKVFLVVMYSKSKLVSAQ